MSLDTARELAPITTSMVQWTARDLLTAYPLDELVGRRIVVVTGPLSRVVPILGDAVFRLVTEDLESLDGIERLARSYDHAKLQPIGEPTEAEALEYELGSLTTHSALATFSSNRIMAAFQHTYAAARNH